MNPDSSNSENSDQSLFNDIKFDDKAFEIVFKENFISLCAFCQYKYRFDLALAKDVVHSAFFKLWEVRQTVVPGPTVKALLYKIITNHCQDILRHTAVEQKHQKHILKYSSESTFDNLDLKRLSTAIDKAVSELPEQMRRVFELSRYQGLKYVEIANHLNISEKTVETQMSRALEKLRKKLSDYLVLVLLYCLLM
jgi:RNA polymerase sigma-70 factor, ECF subfamily